MYKKPVTKKSQIPKSYKKKIGKKFTKLTTRQAVKEYKKLLEKDRERKRIKREQQKALEIEEKLQKELELDDVAYEFDVAREFFEMLYNEVAYIATRTIVRNSTYTSGRSKSRSTINIITNLVSSGETLVKNLLQNILSNDEILLSLHKSLNTEYGGNSYGVLYKAIGDYLESLYKPDIDPYSSLINSDLYDILNQSPLTLHDAKIFSTP